MDPLSCLITAAAPDTNRSLQPANTQVVENPHIPGSTLVELTTVEFTKYLFNINEYYSFISHEPCSTNGIHLYLKNLEILVNP